MSDQVIIKLVNASYLKIDCPLSVAYELNQYFSFKVPNAQFNPKVRNKLWDGIIRLFHVGNKQIYAGLKEEVIQFCKDRDYEVIDQTPSTEEKVTFEDIEQFIEQIDVQLPDNGSAYEYQIQAIVNAINEKRTLTLSPTSCQRKGDKVLTKNGFVNIETLKEGDMVIGADGKEKEIIRTFSGYDDIYKISLKRSNKSPIYVTKNHVLPLKFSDKNKKFGYGYNKKNDYITVENYISKSKHFKDCSNLYYNDSVIEGYEKLPTELTPYFIGVYLGDGHTYCCAVSNIDKEVIDEIFSISNKFDMEVSKKDITYKIKNKKGKRNIILNEFNKLGLKFGATKDRLSTNTKFIPEIFFHISSKERLELLAGLLDTDGYLSKNVNFIYTTKSEQLANDIKRLSITLGFTSHIRKKYNKKYNKFYYDVFIAGDIERIPTRIKRKQAPVIDKVKNQYYKKFDVEYIGKDEFYGFEVKDHLYITNDGMITHNSGKSFIIYVLARYLNMKTIVVVDRKAYVEQIYDDFARYGFDVENNAVKIYGGREKTADKQIVITTWQSIIKLDDEWFKQFDAMIGDEIHKFKAMSLKNIMERLTNCHYRNGFTGTIDDKQLNTLTLMGLFGAIHRTTTTKELIESGRVARPIIKFVKLKYALQDCIDLFSKIAKRKKTDNAVDIEIDHLIPLEKRNKYIINLALSLKGNTIVLFQYKEHGKILFEELQKRENKPEHIYYVDGDVDVKVRKKIQHAIDSHENSITIASIGTFAENINIRHLNNAILAMPIKDKIRLLQALGRILRKTKTKDSAMFFDIIDMFIIKNKSNPTSKYGVERMKIFSKEQLDYKTYTIEV